MTTLQNKIDFALVIAVHHANPGTRRIFRCLLEKKDPKSHDGLWQACICAVG